MALSDTFTALGNTIINLVNSRTAHKQNQLIAGDGIQIIENTSENNADICIHPDIEAAFQGVIDELNMEALGLPVILLEDIADGSVTPPEEPFIVSTNLTEIPDYSSASASPYDFLIHDNDCVVTLDLGSVQRIGRNAYYQLMYNCNNLDSVNLDNLQYVGDSGLYYAFSACTNLTSLYFPSLTGVGLINPLKNMLWGVTGCTVHFPSNFESVIGSRSDVTNGFGGINTTVLFDLPATT